MTNNNNTDTERSAGRAADKARTLNDSLNKLSNDGFDKLARAVSMAATGFSTLPQKRPTEDVVTGELTRLLQQEIASDMRGVFSGGIPGQGTRSGGGNTPIAVIINNNSPAQVTVTETTGGLDQRQLEISIDQMVAQSLVQGRQTSGVLRSLFGLAPDLAGR